MTGNQCTWTGCRRPLGEMRHTMLVPVYTPRAAEAPQRADRFGILLIVTMYAAVPKFMLPGLALFAGAISIQSQTVGSTTPGPAPAAQQVSPAPVVPRTGLNVVVIDPAHGGTDAGGRG